MNPYGQVAAFLRETIGFDAESTGRSTFDRRVKRRMERAGIGDCAAYLDLLKRDREESEALVEDVLVLETWFFRDREPFVFLGRHARDCWRPTHPGATLRVLSAPCATGEEPYSIAIALLEAAFTREEFRIDAADISRQGLENARQALFGKSSFRGPWPFPNRERYFAPEDGRLRLSASVAGLVEFHRANIVEPDFLAGNGLYHVIFCRNVLIYLAEAARQRALAALDRLLAPGGVLVSGHAEMPLLLRKGYQPVRHPRSFACARAVVAAPPPVGPPAESAWSRSRQQRGRAGRVDVDACPQHASPDFLARARALADRGALADAEFLCTQALRHNDTDAEGHYLKAVIRAAAGSLDEAEESLRRALYLRPDHYEALVQMSLLCELKGDAERGSVFRARARRLTESVGGNG